MENEKSENNDENIIHQISNHPHEETDNELGLGQLANKRVAGYIEELASRWEQDPESMHPLSDAILLGKFKTIEERREAIDDDSRGVAGLLQSIATEVRGGDISTAKVILRLHARNDPEALKLLKLIDPDAKPFYPDADCRGERVIPGKSYRFYVDRVQENKPGYYKEGVVAKVEDGHAFAIWKQVGESNPELEGEVDFETSVPTKILFPVEEKNENSE